MPSLRTGVINPPLANLMTNFLEIEKRANSYGLVIRGGFNADTDNHLGIQLEGVRAKSLILLGNAGSSIWDSFSASTEFEDGKADPLNRWSERVGNEMAKKTNGKAFFPFGGPPYQPFIQWAKKAEALKNSNIGMLIHPKYGLWHAYRFAIAYPVSFDELNNTKTTEDICAKCESQACLNTCPVGAFQTDDMNQADYDVKTCYDYLKANPTSKCLTHTCEARFACPEGHEFHYQPDHARFHMTAFYQSLENRFDGD